MLSTAVVGHKEMDQRPYSFYLLTRLMDHCLNTRLIYSHVYASCLLARGMPRAGGILPGMSKHENMLAFSRYYFLHASVNVQGLQQEAKILK